MKTEIIIGSATYCDHSSIQAGLAALAELPAAVAKKMWILAGCYPEYLEIRLSNIEICGLGHVTITGSRCARQRLATGEERGTFRSATVFIEGENILLKNLTIENIAGQGAVVGQAVALFNYGHQTTLSNCCLRGHQDTLCTGPLPELQKNGSPFPMPPLTMARDYCYQRYESCYIEGTIDFIFGGAAADFYGCQLHSRRRGQGNGGFITAASTPAGQAQGYLFTACWLTAEASVKDVYLGRPWRAYAQTSFENCWFGPHIAAAGWDNWADPDNERTVAYREQDCVSSTITARPQWVFQG